MAVGNVFGWIKESILTKKKKRPILIKKKLILQKYHKRSLRTLDDLSQPDSILLCLEFLNERKQIY